jgi:hypothetical protein
MPDVYKKIVLFNIYAEQKKGYTFSKKIKTAECISVDGCSQCTAST